MPDEVDGTGHLKKFQEVIHANGCDQQAAEGKTHGMKDGNSLDKENIDQREGHVDPGNMKDDPFGLPAEDHLVQDIKIEAEHQDTKKVVEGQIGDRVRLHIGCNYFNDACDEEERGEPSQVHACIPAEGSSQAGQEGNAYKIDKQWHIHASK